MMAAWLALTSCLGWWVSKRLIGQWQVRLATSTQHESQTSAHVMNRLFAEMSSVASMVASQGQVVQLASRYPTDPPGFADLTRQERAAKLIQDPLVRKVGSFMSMLSNDLNYGRIYMNNLSDETLTASNWDKDDSIVGMIYTRRTYLVDAMRKGIGHSFGIARLLKLPSYFVASRIEAEDGTTLGAVTVRFDAPDMAHYLPSQHITLIVNRQGRVTTASSEPFMLRNVAALLPPGFFAASADEEDPGEPMNIHPMAGQDKQWLINGVPYLLQHQPLANTQYQLFTLASLEEIADMQRQHLFISLLVAITGLALIMLCGQAAGQIQLRRQSERHAANHDVLTGLPNRRAVLAELDHLFDQAKKTHQWVLVAFIDLDGFKTINDTYGHQIGDQFLAEVARRLSSGLRSDDVLGRLGGDEFVLIGLTPPPAADTSNTVATTMHNRLAPLLVGGYAFGERQFDYAGASFGIVCADPLATSPKEVIKQADQQMYVDKQNRRMSRIKSK